MVDDFQVLVPAKKVSVNRLLFQHRLLLDEGYFFLFTSLYVLDSTCLERKTHCGALLVSQVTLWSLGQIGRGNSHQLWSGSKLSTSCSL
jgi:hypothetical protein